ncbi:MAG: thioredoxin family protein [Candidatus Odinarchaeota archaeon]
MAKELTDETIDEFIQKNEIVILDIFTVWCGPCKLQAKILEDFEKEVDAKRVAIAKIDADQAPVTSQKYRIAAIPTVIMFKDGKPVQTHVGVWPKESMANELAELL